MKRPEEFKKITVVGCGFIGYSWGVVFARAGKDVYMYNRKSNTLDTVLQRITDALHFLADEGVIEEKEIEESLSRIHVTDNLALAVENTDYIQECLWEDIDLKQNIFETLTAMTPEDVPIGSSCSGLRISDIVKNVQNH